MAKLIVKNQLKKGETFIGELDEVSGIQGKFRDENGNTIRVPLPEYILELIEADYYSGDILKITNGDNWEIESLDEWPAKSEK